MGRTRFSSVRIGFSLLEVLIVVGILATFTSLLFPAVSRARRHATARICSDNVRQLALGVSAYESARQHVPPGVLGFDRVIDFDTEWFSPDSPYYWRYAQFTSWLALTLPFREGGSLVATYHPIAMNERNLLSELINPETGRPMFDCFSSIPGFQALAASELAGQRCPADKLEHSNELIYVFGALQVCSRMGVPRRLLTYRPLLEDPSGSFGLSNYAGCTGSHWGGVIPGDVAGNSRSGMMTYRRGLRLSAAKDGLTHTVLLGETVGEVIRGQRAAGQNWLVGGLANGQEDADGTYSVLGDSNRASWSGFGSVHDAGVWLAFGDGHANLLDRSIDTALFRRLCGIADSHLVK